MTAQTAAKTAITPKTPSLPHAKPESLGLSSARLQRMSDAFRREIDFGNEQPIRAADRLCINFATASADNLAVRRQRPSQRQSNIER